MKWFLEFGNNYAKRSDWKDYALTKFCLCAMGVLIGTQIPKAHKTKAQKVALGVFIATYIPLMVKVFQVANQMENEKKSLNIEQ